MPNQDAADIAMATRRLGNLLEQQTFGVDEVVAFVHQGVPIAKERARQGRTNKGKPIWYTPSRTRNAEQDLMWQFKRAMGRRQLFGDTMAMVCLFYVPTRQRKDTDNCQKLVMDAGTKAKIWKDDSQVIASAQFIELDPAQPRTVVAFCPALGTLTKAPLLMAGL